MGRYSPPDLTIQQADLEWGGQRLSVNGRIGLVKPAATLDLNARADGLAVAGLLGVLGQLEVPLNIPGTVIVAHIGGTSRNPKTTLLQPGIQLPRGLPSGLPELGPLLEQQGRP